MQASRATFAFDVIVLVALPALDEMVAGTVSSVSSLMMFA